MISKLWHKLCSLHRSQDETVQGGVREFFLPRLTRGFFLRLAVLAVLAFICFRWLLIPCVIEGASMYPTYPERGFTFCWSGRYWFSSPKRGDVVAVRYRSRVFYLKRVVALAGDTVEFRSGKLYVNGVPADEPYVKLLCDWDLPPKVVEEGCCYVVGDNRSQFIREHRFGSVSLRRIAGAPVF